MPHALNRSAQALAGAFCLLLLPACNSGPAAWWKSINKKAAELNSVDARYVALTAAHEKLKEEHYRLEQEYMNLRAQIESQEMANINLASTGSAMGRAPSSIG